jgi:hypothetical protein
MTGGTLPFVVDTQFFAAGYIGDYSAITNTGDATGTACGGRAFTGAAGDCYKVSYTVPAVSLGYAGVDWQSNLQAMFTDAGTRYDNNFGIAVGVVPPAGATEASFWAKGAAGGELVTFAVGGGSAPCMDSVISSPNSLALTTTWTKYFIAFPAGVTYTAGQVNGFSWSIAGATAASTITFYIDNIVWDMGGGGG